MRHLLVALAIVSATAGAAAPERAPTRRHTVADHQIAVVEKMIDAWNTRNWQLVGDLFTENGVLHSMMIEPVVGRKAIAERINGMGAGIESITLHIHRIGVIGDAVVVERTDEFVYKSHHGSVPVVGVIKVEGDKISEWREYYDRASLVKAMGLSEDFHTSGE